MNGAFDLVKLKYKTDKKLSLILAINQDKNVVDAPLLSLQDVRQLDSAKIWKSKKIELFVPKLSMLCIVNIITIIRKEVKIMFQIQIRIWNVPQ